MAGTRSAKAIRPSTRSTARPSTSCRKPSAPSNNTSRPKTTARKSDPLNGLLTDLYELTMAAGYFAAGKQEETGTFEFTIRRLPRNRDFVVLAGIHRAIDYLLNLSFDAEEIGYLRTLPNFRNAAPGFWDY